MEKSIGNKDSSHLPDATRIGYVELRVHDRERVLKFYRDLLGLREVRSDGTRVYLGAGDQPIFVLNEDKSARPRTHGTTGLFHVAVLYKNRRELARILHRVADSHYPFQGFADHGVSEALYLSDPEGNGIELYADRPRDLWKRKNGNLEMITGSLNIEDLLAELKNDDRRWDGADPETRIGHIHLQVSDLAKAETFYREILGFDVTQRSYPGAIFFAAGGYHHHIGANVWNSRNSAPADPNCIGLVQFSVQVPDKGTLGGLHARLGQLGRPNERSSNGASLATGDFDNIRIVIQSVS